MDEGARFEIVYPLTRIGGSNPSLSATEGGDDYPLTLILSPKGEREYLKIGGSDLLNFISSYFPNFLLFLSSHLPASQDWAGD